ncbi:MAG TPA: type II secretion system F family protein, partial [Verrucomicrobiae bacterium]|nr:type II secretion system F family protein [Verrucomicrobiae bacterium]
MFTCKLGAADGRVFEKDFDAASADILKQNLEDQGFFVFAIRKKSFQFLFDKGIGRRKTDSREILSFNQELLVLLKSGLPLVQALDTILERVDKGFLAETVRDIRDDVKSGISFSDSLSKHPRAFPYLYVASIRAGEKTGDLPLTIRRYNAYLKKAQGLKQKFTGALVYPAILVTVAFFAIAVLLVYVVPTFSQVYADAGSALPLPTQVLIAFAGALRRYLLVLIAAAVVATSVFRNWAQTESGRYRL